MPDFLLGLSLLSAWRYAGPTGWNDVGWSVSTEWFAYVWFPLFLLAAPRLGKVRITLMAILALAVVGAVEVTSPTHLSMSGGVARLIPEFMLGVLLCRLREAMPSYQGFIWGSLLSLLVCAIGVKVGIDIVFVAGAAGLVFSLSYGIDALTGVLSSPSLVFLGEISYCLYIVQRIPQYLFSFARSQRAELAALPAAVQALLLLALTIGAAVLLHFSIERPMRSWINRRFGSSHRSAKSIAGAKNNERDHGGWYIQRKR